MKKELDYMILMENQILENGLKLREELLLILLLDITKYIILFIFYSKFRKIILVISIYITFKLNNY